MELKIADFNDPQAILSGTHAQEWARLERALREMPLHLKSSDQAGKQGSLIFDVKGTNAYIKACLAHSGWQAARIPPEHDFLGIDVDFAKSGVILEVQFSNYPFLLNNLLRSELFFREKVRFDGVPMICVVIVVKAGMFPSSNSTLYYEQALRQLNGLASYKLFSVPIRLVGLFSPIRKGVPANFTTYSADRYARTVDRTSPIVCDVASGRGGRCSITKALRPNRKGSHSTGA
jgi:hypothetical protein